MKFIRDTTKDQVHEFVMSGKKFKKSWLTAHNMMAVLEYLSENKDPECCIDLLYRVAKAFGAANATQTRNKEIAEVMTMYASDLFDYLSMYYDDVDHDSNYCVYNGDCYYARDCLLFAICSLAGAVSAADETFDLTIMRRFGNQFIKCIESKSLRIRESVWYTLAMIAGNSNFLYSELMSDILDFVDSALEADTRQTTADHNWMIYFLANVVAHYRHFSTEEKKRTVIANGADCRNMQWLENHKENILRVISKQLRYMVIDMAVRPACVLNWFYRQDHSSESPHPATLSVINDLLDKHYRVTFF